MSESLRSECEWYVFYMCVSVLVKRAYIHYVGVLSGNNRVTVQ